MSVREVNPNHRTTRAMQDNADMYAKLLCCVLWKYRHLLPPDVLITAEDLAQMQQKFSGTVGTIVVNDQSDGMHLSVVDENEAKRLAKKAGGLPS
jgi:hypothetical protein